MRILIVGAGIGGMTLAALLEQRGMQATLVEREPNFDHAGYMLGLWLWPLGYSELHGLGLYQRCAAECIEGNNYEVRDNHGELVKHWSMQPIAERFGPNLSCTRPQLVKLLHEGLADADLRFRSKLETIEQDEDAVEVGFCDGSHETFDLVVGADSLHSRTRELVFGEQPCFHTGWGGWVWWADPGCVPPETLVEHWGVGRFLGAYATRGRIVLLGDAAAGFLPTAGIGASMAMESAAVLADELSRTNTRSVKQALSLYVTRRKARVERMQDDSRRLARAVTIKSATVAHMRDLALKFYTIERLAGSIATAFEEPI